MLLCSMLVQTDRLKYTFRIVRNRHGIHHASMLGQQTLGGALYRVSLPIYFPRPYVRIACIATPVRSEGDGITEFSVS
jgi:hypothetical protein